MSWQNTVRRAKAATTEISPSDVIEQSIMMTPLDRMLYKWRKATEGVCLVGNSPRFKKTVEVVL